MACTKKAKGALDAKAPKRGKSPVNNRPSTKRPDAMRGSVAKKGK